MATALQPTDNAITPTDVQGIRRTQIVWGTFVSAMTVVCGLLLLANGKMPTLQGGPMLGPTDTLTDGPRPLSVSDVKSEIDFARWKAIVIHHSGQPAGDAEQLHRRHVGWGLDGLGYHFVVGNGNGMADGAVHVGDRWTAQRPGIHVIGEQKEWHNEHAIGICLIGNGNDREFSPRQMQTLAALVAELQRRFEIPASDVVLHRDLSDDVSSPGAYFREADFRAGLITPD